MWPFESVTEGQWCRQRQIRRRGGGGGWAASRSRRHWREWRWAVARQSGRWPLNNASKGQNAGQGATLWEGAYFVLAVSAQGLGQRVGSEGEAWQQS